MDKLNTELFDTIHEFDTSKIPNEEMIEAKKKYLEQYLGIILI